MKKTFVLVCVTQQKTCERLILNGYRLAEAKKGKLHVIHVVNEKEKFLESADDGEALEYLFGVSKKVGADLTVLRSKDILNTMTSFAEDNNITHIIMGTPPNNENVENPNIGLKLQDALPYVDFMFL